MSIATDDAPPLKLLAEDEPRPGRRVAHADGASPFFLTCDHAGRLIPKSLGRLGLPESELERHIAWDIGIAAVSERIADALDATLIMQIYSRLVIDCNRDLLVPSSIVRDVSEIDRRPRQHRTLDPEDRRARQSEIMAPYHERIAARAGPRAERRAGRRCSSPCTASRRSSKASCGPGMSACSTIAIRASPASSSTCCAGRATSWSATTSPISSSDLTDYTIPVHGEKRGLPHVEIEIRQDLITEEHGQREWAERLIRLLPEACDSSPERERLRGWRRPAYIYPTTRDVPVEIPAHHAPLHRRAEFLRGAERRRVQGSLAAGIRGEARLFLRRAGEAASSPTCSACRPAAARPASR